MSLTTLNQVISNISPEDQGAMEQARRHWDSIAKPIGGLGLLEDAVVRMAGVQGLQRVSAEQKGVAVFCADNGVVAQGVTQTGQEVTAAVARSMARGQSSVCHMARVAGAKVFPVDIGMIGTVKEDNLLQRAVRRGTGDITQGPAMTRGNAVEAVVTGVWLAQELARKGYDLLAAGEMGIGNTTTSAAVASVLLNLPAQAVTGRGAGLSNEGLLRKVRAVERAVACNRPDPADPLEILCKVGGLDIAAMTGFYLGAALERVPVLLDGAISCAAALLAVRLSPNSKKAMLASHRPAEPCGRLLLQALDLSPVIDAGLHLGEGTGAVAAMPLLDMALAVYHGMATFDGMGISAYQKFT